MKFRHALDLFSAFICGGIFVALICKGIERKFIVYEEVAATEQGRDLDGKSVSRPSLKIEPKPMTA